MYSKIKKILHYLFHTHYYKKKFENGNNSYYECHCGQRIVKHGVEGYTSVNTLWLEGLE